MRRKMKMKFWEMALILVILFLAVLMLGGCEEAFGLRFSPTEAMRKNAELTHGLARKVNVEGLEPGAEAGRQLIEGTEVSLVYTGRPQTPVDPDDFSTINSQAGSDASKRPDVGGMMDSALEIGLMVATLVGGGAGVTVARKMRQVHKKAKGFNEIVGQVGALKGTMKDSAPTMFKDAFSGQTMATQKLVAEASIEDKVRRGV